MTCLSMASTTEAASSPASALTMLVATAGLESV